MCISRPRLLPAKARERPSGDQNTGAVTPSVPGSACASDEFIGLSQICDRPSPSMAAKASVRPSGEMAGGAGGELVLSRAGTADWGALRLGGGLRKRTQRTKPKQKRGKAPPTPRSFF